MSSMVTCEGCGQFISVEKTGEVFPCPICGCLTLATPATLGMDGYVTLTSKVVREDTDTLKSGRIVLNTYPQDVKNAIQCLVNYGWTMAFTQK